MAMTLLGQWLSDELIPRSSRQALMAPALGIGRAAISSLLTKGHVTTAYTRFRLAGFPSSLAAASLSSPLEPEPSARLHMLTRLAFHSIGTEHNKDNEETH